MQEILDIFKKPEKLIMKNPHVILNYFYVICISEIYFGYTLIYLSAIDFSVIVERYGIDFDIATAQGMFQGINSVGGATGALITGYFVTLLSRKNIIYVFNAVSITLALMTLIPNYKIFFVVRFLQGLTGGVFSSVIPSIIKENSPTEIINITGTFSNLFIILGLVILYVFSYILILISGDASGQSVLELVFSFPAIMLAFQTYLINKYYNFQTTKYLAQNNRYEELKELLTFFYKNQYIDQMYQSSIEHYGVHENDGYGNKTSQKKHSRLALIYAIFYSFLCPFSGINIAMSYGGDCVSRILPSLKSIVPSLLMIWYWLSSFCSIAFINKHGRKQMTLYGALGISSTLFLIAIGYFTDFAFIILIGLFAFLTAFGMTFAPVMWLWASQVIQPEKLGIAIMVNWGGAAIVTTLFPIVIEIVPDRNPGYIFLFFAVYVAISYGVTSKLMIESKGKTQNEIRLQYLKLDQQFYGARSNEVQDNIELNLLKK